MNEFDVIVVGAGLAGLGAATEAGGRGLAGWGGGPEGGQNLGGPAFWALGGLVFLGRPEPRLVGGRGSLGLAGPGRVGPGGV
ncbi:FAD-binding protein [Agrobacterium vitis]|nr:FAD-binding protein [Agrobacterium vitis]MVA74297.1 FAD-binding protein [Agrobacterium vitis]